MINQGARAVMPARTMAVSTAVMLCGLALTSLILPSDGAVDVFTVAAVSVGASLSLATGIEARTGVRSLIRVDILILWVLYALTFLEFLFPQPDIDALVSPDAATSGTYAVLLGFAGLVMGRHLVPRQRGSGQNRSFVEVRPANIFLFFLLATLVGYLHIFLAVNFDPFEMLRQMSLPRFSQSWGRGKYGDLYSLLYELGMLINLIPPIAGLICARRKEYNIVQKIMVCLVLVFTFYYAFASGTRNVIATYVITFAGTYFIMKPRIQLGQALMLGVPTLVLLFIGTTYMLEFRGVGLKNVSFEERHYDTLFIDRNIVNVSKLTQLFPESYGFLGFEVAFNALIKPIPRVLWADKPEGLGTSIESALGASAGTTLSCTFVGEAYMAGGLLAVLFFSLLFGAAAEMWNRVGSDIDSSFSQLLYASGFLCAAIAMRSMLSMVPLMLPTLALWLYGKFWLPHSTLRAPPVIGPNKL
jgi:oligosaccharide repeat unit polymerase